MELCSRWNVSNASLEWAVSEGLPNQPTNYPCAQRSHMKNGSEPNVLQFRLISLPIYTDRGRGEHRSGECDAHHAHPFTWITAASYWPEHLAFPRLIDRSHLQARPSIRFSQLWISSKSPRSAQEESVYSSARSSTPDPCSTRLRLCCVVRQNAMLRPKYVVVREGHIIQESLERSIDSEILIPFVKHL